jgi:hypothetical protein
MSGSEWRPHLVRPVLPREPDLLALTDLAPSIPEMDWRVYGAYGGAPLDEYAAGNISVCSQVADAMADSDVAWHAKAWSDGFGHVIHNWFAIGRPVFGIESYYANQLAGPLWIDGVTSIDIERRSKDEVAAVLRRLRDDEDYHLRMSEAAAPGSRGRQLRRRGRADPRAVRAGAPVTYIVVPSRFLLSARDLYRDRGLVPRRARARVTDIRDGLVFWEAIP